jgi:hypothetical protein
MAVPIREKIKTIFEYAANPSIFQRILSLKHTGYLVDVGWFNAFKSGKPLDKDNKPIPWVTYPFIHFLNEKLHKNLSVFEYGSGNSTLFFAERVKKITSVEHDKGWLEYIKSNVPANVQVLFIDSDVNGKYSKAATNSGEKYNLIFVDAEDRVNCIKNSLGALTDDGVLVFDDSQLKEFTEGVDYIMSQGFRKIDFYGISPGLLYLKATSIYYKPNNCLNI